MTSVQNSVFKTPFEVSNALIPVLQMRKLGVGDGERGSNGRGLVEKVRMHRERRGEQCLPCPPWGAAGSKFPSAVILDVVCPQRSMCRRLCLHSHSVKMVEI